jgi:uncharacterized membrane protein (UPF0127 family)
VSRRAVVVWNRRSGSAACERCTLADTARSRLAGLMGRKGLPSGEGILLRPAGSVHTCFMRFAIDAVFLDRDLRVLRITPGLRPWRAARARGARAVLELPSGECERRGLAVGHELTLQPCTGTGA